MYLQLIVKQQHLLIAFGNMHKGYLKAYRHKGRLNV